jgi:hypothetical protein
LSIDRAALTEDYADVICGMDKLILRHVGDAMSLSTLIAIQSVHIEQLRRCHAVLSAMNKDSAQSFPQYLRALADAHEKAESEAKKLEGQSSQSTTPR